MDMKGNDVVASVAIVREGHLSRVEESRSDNGQPVEETEEETAASEEIVTQGEVN